MSRVGGRGARCHRVRGDGCDRWCRRVSRHCRRGVVWRVERARCYWCGWVARPRGRRCAGVAAGSNWWLITRHHRGPGRVCRLRNPLSHLIRHLPIGRPVFINRLRNLLRLNFRHPDFVPRSTIDSDVAVLGDWNLLSLGLSPVLCARHIAVTDLRNVLHLRLVTHL